MKLEDLERESPYLATMRRLRNPMPTTDALASTKRRSLEDLLDGLRRRHVALAAPLFTSPVIDRSTPLDGVARQTLRNPRRAARLVIADILRTARAAGLPSDSNEPLSQPNRLLQHLLEWMLDMENRPRQERQTWAGFHSVSRTTDWAEVAGPVLGCFVFFRMNRDTKLEDPNRILMRLHDAIVETVRAAEVDWTVAFAREGAAKLRELEGTKRENRRS